MPSLLRPVMHAWALGRLEQERPRPFPAGDPVVTVAGVDPDRVLLVGAGPAVGFGMPDHGSALPGTLARALAARTGRGAHVEARGAHGALVQDLPELVRGAQLQRYDALVVCIGLHDGTNGVPVSAWRRALTAFVDDLRRNGARDATIVLVRIPPASAFAVFDGPLALLADLRIRRLNRTAERLSRELEGVVTASGPTPSPDLPAGSALWYQRYGDALAGVLHARFAGASSR